MPFKIMQVDDNLKIVYLQDLGIGKTITNNAEVVWLHINYLYPDYTIVYRDTDDELWVLQLGDNSMQFERWYGYDWFVLNNT